MIICPNLKNPDVAREFNELVQATSELAAYHIWSLNNGNAIDKAPNGASSKLFLDLLDHYSGDRIRAIQAKAKTYSKSFLSQFGNWIYENDEPSILRALSFNIGRLSNITNNDLFYQTGDNRLKYRKLNIQWLKNYYVEQQFFKDYVDRLYNYIKLYKKDIEAYKFYDESNADDESNKLARVESTIQKIKQSNISRYFDIDTHRLSNGNIKITIKVDKSTILDRILSIIDEYSNDLLYSELQRIDQEGSEDYLYYINPRKVLTLKDQILRKVAYWDAAVVDESMQFLIDLPNNPENNLFVECCIRWLKNNAILLPRDAEKVKEIFNLAREKHIDVQRAKSPLDLLLLILANKDVLYDRGPIDMSKYTAFTYSRSITVNGEQVDIYDVLDNSEGRQQVCLILADNAPKIDGKIIKFSPWCLSTHTIDSNGVAIPSPSAVNHWGYYDTDVKRLIAVYKGKPVAFRSSGDRYITWWDFNDSPHKYNVRDYDDNNQLLDWINLNLTDLVYKSKSNFNGESYKTYQLGNYEVTFLDGILYSVRFDNSNSHINITSRINGSVEFSFFNPGSYFINIDCYRESGSNITIEWDGYSLAYLNSIFDGGFKSYSINHSILLFIKNYIEYGNTYTFGYSRRTIIEAYSRHQDEIKQYVQDYLNNHDGESKLFILMLNDASKQLENVLTTIPMDLQIIRNLNVMYDTIKELFDPVIQYAANMEFTTDQELSEIEASLPLPAHPMESTIYRSNVPINDSLALDYTAPPVIGELLQQYAQKEDWYQRKYDEYIGKPVNKELAEILHNILKEYHFEIIEQDLTNLFGEDTKGALDFVQKIVYLANEGDRDAITDAEEFSHAFIKLMGARYRGEKTRDVYKENKKYSELIDLVSKTPFYLNIYEKYKKVKGYVNEFGDIDIMKIKEEALGKALAVVLNDRYDTIKNASDQETKTLFERISEWFNAVIRRIKKLLTRDGRLLDKLLNELDKVADSILDGTYTKKYLKKLNDSGWKNYSYQQTIDYAREHEGELGIRLMLDMVNLGGIVTGSLSYRAQTPVKRAGVDYLHDIDIAFPLSSHGIQLQYPRNPHRFPSMYFNGTPERPSFWTKEELLRVINENPRGSQILRTLETYPNYRILFSFTTDGDILLSGVFSENEKAVEKFVNSEGSYKSRMKNLTKKELKLIFVVDIFLNGSDSVSRNTIEDLKNNLKLTHFSESFRKKLKFGRAKDIYDYLNLDPNNRVYKTEQDFEYGGDYLLEIQEGVVTISDRLRLLGTDLMEQCK